MSERREHGDAKEKDNASSQERRKAANVVGQTARLVVGIGVIASAYAAVLFGISGHLDWGMAWALLILFGTGVCVSRWVLQRANPGVLEVRTRQQPGAKKWDLVVSSFIQVFWFAALVLAAQDRRFGWSHPVPLWVSIVALAVVMLGGGLFVWAMTANKFFSRLVRIQTDRGHRVVTAGPYQYVRHPGYVGWILMAFAVPLVLGSLWMLIPVGLAVGVMVFRTGLEDRTLHAELEGYSDYAHQVRYRLLPGIW